MLNNNLLSYFSPMILNFFFFFFSNEELRQAKSEEASEFMTLVKNACDLVMAVNWLPSGFLWADKIPPARNAFFGVISSFITTAMFLKQEALAKKKE